MTVLLNTGVIPVNAAGEIVAQVGSSDTKIVGYLNENFVPVDSVTGAMMLAGISPKPVLSRSLGCIGDSITARWTGGAAVAGNSEYRQPFGWLKWALELSGQGFTVDADFSKSGSGCTPATANVVPTFQTQLQSVLASSCTDVTLFGPVNDFIQVQSLSTVIINFQPILDSLVAAGKRVWLHLITPVNASYTGTNSTVLNGNIMAFNDYLRSRVIKYGQQSVVLVDSFASVVDPVTGSFPANLVNPDFLHPRNSGAYLMGKAQANAWIANGVRPISLISTAFDAKVNEAGAELSPLSTNILQNGMFNLGTPASGVAQNWTKANTGGASSTGTIVTPSPGTGSGQQLACTFAASGDSVTLTSSNFATRVTATDKIVATARVTVGASPVNLKNVRMRLQAFGNVTPTFHWGLSDSTDNALPEGWTGIMRADLDLAQWGVIGALNGGFLLTFFVEGAGAGSATVTISEVSVRVV